MIISDDVISRLHLSPVTGTMYGGFHGDWAISLTKNGLLTLSIDGKCTGRILKDIKKAVKGTAEIASYPQRLLFKFKKKVDPVEAVSACVNAAQEAGLEPAQSCSFCKQSGCDAAAPLAVGIRPVHRSCVRQAVESANDQAEHAENSGSYLTGIIGALLGMMAGCVPTLLTIFLLERIIVLVVALIPLGAYYGYKLLRGKLNKAAIVITCLMSVLGVFFMGFVEVALSFKDYYDLTVSQTLNLFFLLLPDGSIWSEIAKSSTTEFFFVALGLFWVWRTISATPASDAVNAAKLMDSLIARPGYSAAEAVPAFTPSVSTEPVSEESSVCPYCGGTLKPGAGFCPSCGAKQ